jgi:hypothetical protein
LDVKLSTLAPEPSEPLEVTTAQIPG